MRVFCAIVITILFFLLFIDRFYSQQNYGEFNRNMIIRGKNGSEKTSSYLHSNPNYDLAIQHFLELLKTDSDNVNYLIDLAFTYFKSPYQKTLCIPYGEKAIKLGKPEAVAELYYPLGIAYRMTGQYEKAISALKTYTENLKTYDKFLSEKELTKLISEVNREILVCQNAIELNENLPIKFFFDNTCYNYFINSAGKKVNSAYDDYNPIILNDTIMIFTSRRNSPSIENFQEDGRCFEDIFSSTYENKNWTEAKKLNINTNKDESANSISGDKKKLYLIRNERQSYILSSEYSDGKWQKPKKIQSEKNSKVWENCLGVAIYDSVVYFVKNTKDGFGGKDIYKSVKLDDGTWSDAVNLGPTINTPYQEESPFLSSDGKYLYFASNGHNTMGGFDIFRSKFINNSWTTPENLLAPINSENNELYFSITKEGKTAYLSSQRIRAGRNDMNIYQITFKPEFEDAKYAMLQQNQCSCKLDSNLHSRYIYDNSSGTISLKGVEVQYFFDDGKIITGDKMDSKGRFPSREISYDNPYSIRLKTPDSTFVDQKTLCEHGKIVVRGPGGALYLMAADENCIFRVKTIKAKFIYSLLEKEFVQGLKIQVLDETGAMICEETTDENGEFCYSNPEHKYQLFKLVTDTPAFYKDAEIVVLGPNKKFYKFIPDENAIFRPEEFFASKKIHYHSYRKLLPDTNYEEICGSIYPVDESSVPPLNDLNFQILGQENEVIAETKTNDNGEFCFVQKTGKEVSVLKLMNEDTIKFKNTEIVLAGAGKKITKFRPDSTNFFRPVQAEEDLTVKNFSLLNKDTNYVNILGNVYYNNDINKPAKNIGMILKNEKHEIYKRSLTDNTGTFVFDKIPVNQSYSIMMDETSPSFNSNMIYLILGNVEFFGQKISAEKFKLYLDGKYDENLITMVTDKKGRFQVSYLPGIYHTQVDKLEEKDSAVAIENIILENKNSSIENKKDTFLIINFGYDKSLIEKEYSNLLDELCARCLKDTMIRFQLTGHTDSNGSDEYNLKLSKLRAEIIANYMVSKGVNKNSIEIIAAGELHPIAPNRFPDGSDNPDGRQKNRRVEINMNR